jgi:2-isopropylmalate synthase
MTQQPESDRVIIFDTTLRDGEQSPGASLNVDEKLTIARQLARLGVDIIEAGFPYASKGDFEAVQTIAEQVGGKKDSPIICGLARASEKDIKKAAQALEPAANKRIHTFIATSDIHLEYKLKKTRPEVLQIAGEMVAYAKSFVDDVEFSPEDAGRSDPEFLYEVLERAIANGATTVNIPDTVGYTTPAEFGALIKGIKDNVPNIDKAIISVHGHNDLGLAVANFLEAVKYGARQLECTINGIGERAGNAALEELVMALHVRRQYFNPFLGRSVDSTASLTGINTREIRKTSRMVSDLTGMLVQPNKAIVGKNAFAHESGIHQDGVLKNPLTYEIMDGELVGANKEQIDLGKLSGRNALRNRLLESGIDRLSENDLNQVFLNFKNSADKIQKITDRDLEEIVKNVTQSVPKLYKLILIKYSSNNDYSNGGKSPTLSDPPSATVIIQKTDGEFITTKGEGDGSIDAAYKAIAVAVGIESSKLKLPRFSIESIGDDTDAQGVASITVEYEGRKYKGRGSDSDIIIAAAEAYLNAMNRIHADLASRVTVNESSELVSGILV